MNQKATWSPLLESYHPYLLPQKVSKNPKIYCIHSSLPKNANSHFGFLRILVVNEIEVSFILPSLYTKLQQRTQQKAL
jgi:hypothetical protein